MTDISKCDGVYHKNSTKPLMDGTAICPFREACYRYTAMSSGYQSWTVALYDPDTDECQLFYGRK